MSTTEHNNDDFTSVKDFGQNWNPKKDAEGNERHEATDADFVLGYYVKKEDGVGKHGSTVHQLESEEGIKISIWGDTVLNAHFDKVKLGSFVKVKWEGRRRKKDVKESAPITDKNSFNDWDIRVHKTKVYEGLAEGSPLFNEKETKAPVTNKAMAQEQVNDDLPF